MFWIVLRSPIYTQLISIEEHMSALHFSWILFPWYIHTTSWVEIFAHELFAFLLFALSDIESTLIEHHTDVGTMTMSTGISNSEAPKKQDWKKQPKVMIFAHILEMHMHVCMQVSSLQSQWQAAQGLKSATP